MVERGAEGIGRVELRVLCWAGRVGESIVGAEEEGREGKGRESEAQNVDIQEASQWGNVDGVWVRVAGASGRWSGGDRWGWWVRLRYGKLRLLDVRFWCSAVGPPIAERSSNLLCVYLQSWCILHSIDTHCIDFHGRLGSRYSMGVCEYSRL